MKYKSNIVNILIGSLILFSHLALAQDFVAGDVITIEVKDYSLIETNHAPVSLTLSSSVVGAPLSEVSNSDMFLKLSSITDRRKKRKVTARIASGIVPSGTTLKLVAANCTTANSGGKLGRVSPPIDLTSTDREIIKDIQTCYTGTGYNDGYQLTYTWIPGTLASEYDLIKSTSSTVNISVVFTLTAMR